MNDKYVNQKNLPEYREKHKPKKCLILGIEEYKAVVDHDHNTGRIRGVISSEGNVLIGKIENFFRSRCTQSNILLPDVLRKVAEYLEMEQGPYHPVGVRQLVKRFVRMPKEAQIDILKQKYSLEQISSCKNSADRSKLYRQTLIEE